MTEKIISEILRRKKRKFSPDRLWKLREKAITTRYEPLRMIYEARYNRFLEKAGAYIPLKTCFETRPFFPHWIYGIFISQGAKIGSGCTIFHHVTIGSNTLPDSCGKGFPTIGNNVFIGAGATIIGGITIGDNVRIGANCVVTCDVPANATVVSEKSRIIIHEGIRKNTFIEVKM